MTVSVPDYFRTGRAPRPPLVTTLFDYAATLNGISPDDLIADPAGITRAMLEMHRLFQTDVVTVKLSRPIKMAAGIDPDADTTKVPLPDVPAPETVMPAVAPLIDAVTRLASELKRKTPILAVIPGPASLFGDLQHVDLPAVATLLRALGSAACEAGASLLLIDEVDGQASTLRFAQAAAQAVNTARYYTAKVIVAGDSAAPKALADGLLLPAGLSPPAAAGQRIGFRLTLEQCEKAEMHLAASSGRAGFISIDDAAVAAEPVETVLALFEQLRALSA